VEVLNSSKKMVVVQQEPQINAYGEIEIDLPPVMVEKEVLIETFEVGIQTENMEIKYLLQESLDDSLADQKRRNRDEEKKQRKQKGISSYSEDSTVIEENEIDSS
jgi:hypothetical protein